MRLRQMMSLLAEGCGLDNSCSRTQRLNDSGPSNFDSRGVRAAKPMQTASYLGLGMLVFFQPHYYCLRLVLFIFPDACSCLNERRALCRAPVMSGSQAGGRVDSQSKASTIWAMVGLCRQHLTPYRTIDSPKLSTLQTAACWRFRSLSPLSLQSISQARKDLLEHVFNMAVACGRVGSRRTVRSQTRTCVAF